MDFSKYKLPPAKNAPPFPKKPVPPSEKATSEDHRSYADALDKYTRLRKEVDDFWGKRIKLENELSLPFKDDALKEVGLADHPKRDAIYAFAWEEGHANGLEEVFHWLEKLADLVL